MSLRQLQAVFDRSHTSLAPTLPIQKTSLGIWVPTPLQVIETAGVLLQNRGWLDSSGRGHHLDAGTGDGRVGMLLSRLDTTRAVYGIERDPRLYARARDNLEKMGQKGLIDPARVRVVEGDYCDTATYLETQIAFRHSLGLFPARLTREVAPNLSPHARAGDREGTHEAEVGILRSPGLGVVLEVVVPVGHQVCPHRIRGQPVARPIVEGAVLEEGAVRGFVHDDGKAELAAPDGKDSEQDRERVGRPCDQREGRSDDAPVGVRLDGILLEIVDILPDRRVWQRRYQARRAAAN